VAKEISSDGVLHVRGHSSGLLRRRGADTVAMLSGLGREAAAWAGFLLSSWARLSGRKGGEARPVYTDCIFIFS
jgi:hypothetical protein